MPKPGHADSRWGYVGTMFVRDNFRNRGIGSGLLAALIAAADKRSYARLVVSPSRCVLARCVRSLVSVAVAGVEIVAEVDGVPGLVGGVAV
jgi:GNAT superfamily N-acetyltransferase